MSFLCLFGLKASLIEWITSIQASTATQLAQTAIQAMSFSSGSSVERAVLQVCYSWFNPIAFVLVAVYLTSGLIRTVMAGHELDTQMIVRFGVAIIISDILIANDAFLAGKLLTLSSAMNSQLSGALDAATTLIQSEIGGDAAAQRRLEEQGGGVKNDDEKNTIQSKAQDNQQADTQAKGGDNRDSLDMGSAFHIAFYAMFAGIGWLVAQFAKMALLVVCYIAKAEFVIRLAFAPIAFSGFADAEQRDPSLRYLRKLIASAFYCLSISLTIFIICVVQSTSAFPEIGSGDSAGMMTTIWTTLSTATVPFAAVGAVSTAKGIIQEAFGG